MVCLTGTPVADRQTKDQKKEQPAHTMQSALVLGNATSTVKHPSLENLKLLVCQPLQSDGKTPDGAPLIAVDHLGAGRGETVMLTSDGGAVRETFGVENSPIRWSVLGLIDEVRLKTKD